ncbi:MAG: hypothetical protein NZM28_09200 [Fimbriimonadales bacterium]|nr:hypothetical protein [Fimbriimonadales bacterium]
MQYLFTKGYAGLEQLLGRDGIALLCKAAEDVRRHEGDLDALFREWVVRPLYTEAYYKRLLQESEFRESLNALRAELAQYIVQAYQANPEEPLWRRSYWWWEIPEACDTPAVSFVEQWKLPERSLGDIIGNLLQAVDLHLRERVPLETALSREPLTFWGVKWSQLKELENRLLLAVAYLDSQVYLLLKDDSEARPLLTQIEQVNAHLSEAIRYAFGIDTRPKVWYMPAAFGRSLLWVRYMSRVMGKQLAMASVESEWRELIRRKACEPDSLPVVNFLADFQELQAIVENMQVMQGKLSAKQGRTLAVGMPERAAESFYLRTYRNWSWSQIANLLKRKEEPSHGAREAHLRQVPKDFTKRARVGVELINTLVYGDSKSTD